MKSIKKSKRDEQIFDFQLNQAKQLIQLNYKNHQLINKLAENAQFSIQQNQYMHPNNLSFNYIDKRPLQILPARTLIDAAKSQYRNMTTNPITKYESKVVWKNIQEAQPSFDYQSRTTEKKRWRK